MALSDLKESRSDLEDKGAITSTARPRGFDVDDNGGYVPKTRATRDAQMALLSLVQRVFSVNQHSFIRVAMEGV